MYYFLHILAMVTMLVDHIGIMFFPEYQIFRYIGRIAFPLYAYFLVSGYHHTRNKYKYFIRLLITALISEPFRDLMVFGFNNEATTYLSSQNVCYTLCTGFIAMVLSDRIYLSGVKHKKLCAFLIFLSFGVLSDLAGFSYEFIGIILIYFHYIAEKDESFKHAMAPCVFIFMNFLIYPTVEAVMYLTVILDVILLIFYKDEKIKVNKTFSKINQWFYPVHLVVLLTVQLCFI